MRDEVGKAQSAKGTLLANPSSSNLVTARDWQGVPILIDNFNIRFRPINKLEEPNHQAVMNLVQENVKEKGEQFQGLVEEIKTRSDVSEDYLNSKLT